MPAKEEDNRYLVFWLPQDFTNCIVVDANSEEEACTKALKELRLSLDAKSYLRAVSFEDLAAGWRLWW